MDFALTEEQALLRSTVRDFADRELVPHAAHLDENAIFPHDHLKRINELGLTGIGIPSEYGGSGGDNVMVALTVEEIARGDASTSTVFSVTLSLVNHTILEFGSEDQKARYIPGLTSGALLGAYGLTEASAGSDAGSLQTRARRDGDEYVLTGNKLFISNGDQADVVIVFASTDPAKGSRGVSAFIVDVPAPGFTVTKVEKKLGIRASSTAALAFDEVRVPVANRLGDEGQGFKIALSVLDWSRIGIAAQAVGIAQAAYEAAIAYAKQREQFGKTIGEFQAIQWMIADMATRIDAARLLVYRAADMRDRGLKHTAESSMAKLFASEMCEWVCSKAIQIHGGSGYLKDFPVERYYRDARITQIYEGTSEVQRIVISRNVM